MEEDSKNISHDVGTRYYNENECCQEEQYNEIIICKSDLDTTTGVTRNDTVMLPSNIVAAETNDASPITNVVFRKLENNSFKMKNSTSDVWVKVDLGRDSEVHGNSSSNVVTPQKRKLNYKTMQQKYNAIQDLDKGIGRKMASMKYGVPVTTLSTWYKQRKRIELAIESGHTDPTRNRIRRSRTQLVEKNLYEWYVSASQVANGVTVATLKERAHGLSMLSGDDLDNWLVDWMERFRVAFPGDEAITSLAYPATSDGLTYTSGVGGANAVSKAGFAGHDDHDAVTNDIAFERETVRMDNSSDSSESVTGESPCNAKVPPVSYSPISKYRKEDVFTVLSTRMYYDVLPDVATEICNSSNQLLHQPPYFTAVLAFSASGAKLPLFVIGRTARPASFSGVHHLPCRYRGNKEASLDENVLEAWLREADARFVRERRRVVIVVGGDENVDCRDIGQLRAVSVHQVTSTERTSSMNEIIRELKARYRTRLVQTCKLASEQERPPQRLSLLDALNYITLAWDNLQKSTLDAFHQRELCRMNICFDERPGRIPARSQADHELVDPIRTHLEPAANCFELLSRELAALCSVEQKYFLADAYVDVDEQICKRVQMSTRDSQECEDQPPVKQRSHAEIREMLNEVMIFSMYQEKHGHAMAKAARSMTQLLDISYYDKQVV